MRGGVKKVGGEEILVRDVNLDDRLVNLFLLQNNEQNRKKL